MTYRRIIAFQPVVHPCEIEPHRSLVGFEEAPRHKGDRPDSNATPLAKSCTAQMQLRTNFAPMGSARLCYVEDALHIH